MKQAIQQYLEKHGFEALRPKAVLFDMDGVLYDSMSHHAVAWQKSMATFGIRMTVDDAYATEGARGVDTIRMMVKRQQGRDIDEMLLKDFGQYLTEDHIVTAYDVKHGKPAPDPYLMGLQKCGNLKPWEAFVVENAPLGVKAGVAAQIFTLAVNTGPLPDKVLADAGANLIFAKMPDLAEAWHSLISSSV